MINEPNPDQSKKTVVIAGATGFLGKWFIEKYKQKYKIIALSRKKVAQQPEDGVEWRQVELYSITSTTDALAGADYALYLVHSMVASTRLNQGSFEDTDLLLADNFARAASTNRLEQIIFVGGILPKDTPVEDMSTHLRSRFEVEQTLAERSTPVTTLRAGIILGPGGSSFNIVQKLVKRLPVMICPQWTESLTQPIALQDMLQCIDLAFGNEPLYNQSIEVGGREIFTYRKMLEETARLMGKKRLVFSVPFFTIGLSKLWVGFFSDSSAALVSPLVESLRHSMILDENAPVHFPINYTSFEDAIKFALSGKAPKLPKFVREDKIKNTVRSFQRIPNPGGKSSAWAANRYKTWLPHFFKFIIRAKEFDNNVAFSLAFIKKPMLVLTLVKSRSDSTRHIFYITGGWLVKRVDYGWLEFRSVMGNKFIITAIHEFVPTLPWYMYVNTQARLHLWVMNNYRRYFAKLT